VNGHFTWRHTRVAAHRTDWVGNPQPTGAHSNAWGNPDSDVSLKGHILAKAPELLRYAHISELIFLRRCINCVYREVPSLNPLDHTGTNSSSSSSCSRDGWIAYLVSDCEVFSAVRVQIVVLWALTLCSGTQLPLSSFVSWRWKQHERRQGEAKRISSANASGKWPRVRRKFPRPPGA
jgi:hypothetical protein